MGNDDGPDVLDTNEPPDGQPGNWCQWVPSLDGKYIQWNGASGFEHYDEWIVYLITHFLAPFDYTLNGEVKWYGEDHDDIGKIVVEDNKMQVLQGEIVYA